LTAHDPDRRELIAGLAAAAVVLPQAVGLGMAFWQQAASIPAWGAAAGLITAACLSIASSLARGTAGMIAAPTGPTFALLAGAAAALQAAGVHEPTAMAAAIAVLVASAGALQLLIGWWGWGAWIKFIPYPVVSGFMTGAGVLMLLSQLPVLQLGRCSEAAFVASFAAMALLPRFSPRLPAPLIALLLGIAVFFGLDAIVAASPQETIAPSAVAIAPPRLDLAAIEALPWSTIALYAAALAVLASLDSLLTSIVSDVSTGLRHDAKRELTAQGAGHLLLAGLGGMAGAGTTAATLVALRLGGRYRAGAVAAGVMLAALFALPLLAQLPKAAFAGVIAWVGVLLLDREILRWLRTPQARLDGAIALVVAIVTVAYDLMAAVALGVGLAVIEFIRTQASDAIVRRRWTRNARPSVRRRARRARAFLAENGEAIVGYDLKGVLFFGTAERLRDAIERELGKARFIVLDLRRVLQVDLTAWRLLAQIDARLRERNGALLLSHLPHLAPKEAASLHVFAETNEAVEYAEDRLLAEAGIESERGQRVKLAQCELLQGLDPEAQAALQRAFRIVRIDKGKAVFRAGEHGDALFVLLSGEVEIWLRAPDGARMRLAVYPPGASFGELSFLEPGPRAADAIATTPSELAKLSREDFDRFAKQHPDAAQQLLLRMARDLAENLRQTDQALLRLIE